jgi:hypothetical protein
MKKIIWLFILLFVSVSSVYLYKFITRKNLEAKVTTAIKQTKAYEYVTKVADSINSSGKNNMVENTVQFLNANSAVLGYKELELNIKSPSLKYKFKNYYLIMFDEDGVLKAIKHL